jgi:hypothetical protein
MGLFKRRPDPLTIAMSIVDQFRSGDPGAAQRGIDMIESVTPGDVLSGLVSVGQMLSSHWKPEQIERIREEFAGAAGMPAVRQAVKAGGPLLLVNPDANAATQAILGALQEIQDNKAEVINLVLVEMASAVARIFNALDISLEWK